MGGIGTAVVASCSSELQDLDAAARMAGSKAGSNSEMKGKWGVGRLTELPIFSAPLHCLMGFPDRIIPCSLQEARLR